MNSIYSHPAITPPAKAMLTIPECAGDAGVSRRFLEMEIQRGRLVAVKLSPRIVRVRRRDWEAYVNANATAAIAV